MDTFDSESDTVEFDVMYDNNIDREYVADGIGDTKNRSRVRNKKKKHVRFYKTEL